jgi:hypothetical protein
VVGHQPQAGPTGEAQKYGKLIALLMSMLAGIAGYAGIDDQALPAPRADIERWLRG